MPAQQGFEDSQGLKFDPLKFGPGRPQSQDMVRDLEGLYDRLHTGTLRPDDTVPLQLGTVEGHPTYLAQGLKTGEINQPDAVVFKHLTADRGIIVDAGAHWGYMAMSILNSGTTCPVISIEAISSNAACLKTIRDASPKYDFLIAAVSSAPGEVTFYNPVINGIPMNGVNSINGGTLGKWWVTGTVETIEKYYSHALLPGRRTKLQLGVYTVEAQPLDAILATRKFRFPTSRIAALKIDVEGHERAAIDGAMGIIARDHPLLVIEGGSINGVKEFMTAAGYTMVQRNTDYLEPVFVDGVHDNEFFVHHSQAETYKRIGLLRG